MWSASLPPSNARMWALTASRSVGLSLFCGGSSYFAPGSRQRFVAVSNDACLSASLTVMVAPSISMMLLYLPIISATSKNLTASRSSLRAVMSKQKMRSSPSMRQPSTTAPVKNLRSSMQNDGALTGFCFLREVKWTRGFCAFAEIASARLTPPERTARVISSSSGI